MDGQLYIRVRGRVLGPYDQEKLQSLARRGQLSRMHELSEDGANWARAANYPELFVGAQVEMPAARLGTPESVRGSIDGYEMAAAPGQQAPSSQQRQQQWHYTAGGVQRGPVDFANLQLLVGTGQVRMDDLVWTDGMAAWVPASNVPGLGAATAGKSDVAMSAKDLLPDIILKSFKSSRPWIMFIIVAAFIYAVLQAVGGICLLIAGGESHNPVVVAWGIFAMLWAFDWAVGGFLLGSYHSRLGNLLSSKSSPVLEKAHDRLAAIWVYVAVNLVICLVLVVVGGVWGFSAGVTLPWR